MEKKCCFLFVLTCVFWQVVVSQNLIIWRKADSPILIKTIFQISKEEKLLIEAGAIIEISQKGLIEVLGELEIAGTAQDSAVIRKFGNMACFHLLNNDNRKISINHANFHNETPKGTTSFIQIENSNNLRISNTTFQNGNANLGGAIMSKNSKLKIMKCSFQSNFGNQKGGAIYSDHSEIVIERSIFNSNRTAYFGGVIALDNASSIWITSSLFSENQASYGGVLSCELSKAEVVNITAVNNLATYGGIYYLNASEIVVYNSIMWNNLASNGYIAYAHDKSVIDCDYCCYELHEKNFINQAEKKMVLFDLNSVHKKPVFYLSIDKKYSLNAYSPCINAGTKELNNLFLSDFDLDDKLRIQNGRIDIGAYEWTGKITDNNILTDYTLFKFDMKNSATELSFQLLETNNIIAQILTADNKVIKEYNFENLSSGEHQFVWDGTDFKEQKAANGYYFFRILRKD